LFKHKNTVQQWACKLKSAPATAVTWYLQGCML